MTKYVPFLLLFCSLFTTSCARLAMWYSGVSNPRYYSYDQQKEFLLKYNSDTTGMLCVGSSAGLKAFWADMPVPEAIFFNKSKKFVPYKPDNVDCNAGVDAFIAHLEQINSMPAGDSLLFKKLTKNLVYTNGMNAFCLDNEAYDAYVVMSWAKFAGKINEDKVFLWEQELKKVDPLRFRVKVIKVGCDLQDGWEASDKEQIGKVKLNAK